MNALKVALIGAGQRGADSYAPYAQKYPHEIQFVAVAEPKEERRCIFASTHKIPAEMCFTSWENLLSSKLDLDGVIIANQDQEHYKPCMAALKAGYHVLLEKPIAETIEKTTEIVHAAAKFNRLLMVCHVLRYTDFYLGIKEIIDAGTIGKIMNIDQVESIGNWHFSHSFVRGNWRKTSDSTAMIIAKCCHDFDIINFLMDSKCKRLSSFGSLLYFNKDNCPNGAATRCTECIHNKTCNFSAYRYLTDKPNMHIFRDIVLRTPNNWEFTKNLETSQYGRCVYQCDNDVVDHQVVSMEYENGAIATLTASAFSRDTTRQIKVMGTLAEIEGCIDDNCFYVKHFGSGEIVKHTQFPPKTLHSGGDERIMAHFCEALRNPKQMEYSAEFSLMGHEMAFAAEESRLNDGKVIHFYMERI